MRIPTITATVPTQFDTFWSGHTNVDGRTFTADNTEFGAPGEATNRIALTVHQKDREWGLPAENQPFADHAFRVRATVVSGKVAIDIGDVTVYLPVGQEQAVVDALTAAITEQARQAKAGEDICVVNLTGTEVTA